MASDFLHDKPGWNIKCVPTLEYQAYLYGVTGHALRSQKEAIELVKQVSESQAVNSWHRTIVTSIGPLCGCFQQLDS